MICAKRGGNNSYADDAVTSSKNERERTQMPTVIRSCHDDPITRGISRHSNIHERGERETPPAFWGAYTKQGPVTNKVVSGPCVGCSLASSSSSFFSRSQ